MRTTSHCWSRDSSETSDLCLTYFVNGFPWVLYYTCIIFCTCLPQPPSSLLLSSPIFPLPCPLLLPTSPSLFCFHVFCLLSFWLPHLRESMWHWPLLSSLFTGGHDSKFPICSQPLNLYFIIFSSKSWKNGEIWEYFSHLKETKKKKMMKRRGNKNRKS